MAINFITSNEKKLKEMKRLIPYIKQIKLDLPEIQSNSAEEIIERKLHDAHMMHHNLEFMVEDTSFYMEALNSFPGPFLKYFLDKNTPKDIYEIAKNMNNYNASARTIIGYINTQGEESFFEGTVYGKIVKPITDTKYGLDPIFKPNNSEKTFGEMKDLEKNLVSMRGISARKFKEFYDKL